jgi:predicted MFS family arabinose efflux permease
VKSPLPWRLLLLSVLIVSLSTQPVFLLGAGFLQIGDELGFSATGLGVLTGSFFLTASVVSPSLGRVVQRIGWRKSIRINTVLSSSLLVAIAAFARSSLTLGILLVLSAAVYGFSNPSANLTLAEYINPHQRGLIFGLKHAGIPTSTLLAGLAVPALIVSVGWRWAYVAAAALGIIVFLLVPAGERHIPKHPGEEDPRRQVAPLKLRGLLGLGAGSALAAWAAIALSTYLVAAAVDVGFSESSAGLLLFAGSAASITGRIAAGRITDRIGARGFGGIAVLTTIGAIVFALLPASSGAVFGFLVLIAFATGWGWPGLMTYAVVNANRGTVASSSAITQAGVFVGAGAGPLVLGWVADRYSFDAVWLVVTAALVGAAVVVSLVGRSALAAD